MDRELFGGIDAGGTSFRCIVARGPGDIIAETSFPTTGPADTLQRTIDFFTQGIGAQVASIGMACFGPIAVNPLSPNYGHILKSSKLNWQFVDVVGPIAEATGKKVVLETDVNAAAVGEAKWGAGRGLSNICYVTVGTGIGAGIIVDGECLHGALHAEAGHIFVPRHPHDHFPGLCPFHGDCVEGMASAPAIKQRWATEPAELSDDHVAWEIEAHYLAHLAASLMLITATQRVIYGGGVLARNGLVEKIAEKTTELLNGYGESPDRPDGPLVVPAGLGLKAGALGAIALAQGAATYGSVNQGGMGR